MNDFSTDLESARAALEAAILHQLRGQHSSVDRIAGDLAADGVTARAVDAAATRVIQSHLQRLWDHGWLPDDVCQMVRRKCRDMALSLIVDAIAAHAAAYTAATIHPRWQEQLDRLDARVWWSHNEPQPSQWSRRHGVTRRDLLRTVIELVALLRTLGPLPLIVPPPGKAADKHSPGPGTVTDEKILSKIRSLLAKAESTEFPDEAEALSAKAQELMARHSIENARASTTGAREPSASARRIWIDAPYVSAKSYLVGSVAGANRCRSVSYDGLGFVTVIGDDIDLDHVELLVTSLMVQATRAMLSSGSQVTATGKSRTRSFRHSFLIAYAARVGERLREINRQSMAAAGAELVPVFARRREAVDRLFASLYPGRLATRSISAGNAAGYGAGRAAADQAVLRAGRRELGPRR
ncbi:DUF2786 domain-containing protein [Phytoactinopolyspora halotolerans]|uniref:DUF2786 domain-containing protein n=1 Tax=Phytoactinopolyspora halotolerans TaxID=1981512 RepID=A0A6L9S0N7_9ACTN|nr:DUF2786 domain-containing protein [Phytoactinopolyspora halotolerans]NED98735.1 DUF2786 domain-containing protein [Phytoactinopolyspora halotolerans]